MKRGSFLIVCEKSQNLASRGQYCDFCSLDTMYGGREGIRVGGSRCND